MSESGPDWVADAVFYQIFPDRFARSASFPRPVNLESWNSPPTSNGFKGGDLLGIVEHLDYLIDLGITALYLNPVFKAGSNHRYDTYDYFEVDPLLGGNDALRRLIDECHGRGLRVVLDGVFNHVGRGFFQFHSLLESRAASPYRDWFHVNGFPLNAYDHGAQPNYAAWWGIHSLPKLNIASPNVRNHIFEVAERWIEFGADGWRLDVPEEINEPGFWEEFRARVKAVNSDAYIVGEIWRAAPDWTGSRFDGLMNYPFCRAALGAFVEDSVPDDLVQGMGYAPIPQLDLEAFASEIESLLAAYPPATTTQMLNLLGSHDTARLLTLARDDESAVRLAILLQMTYPGAPCIYYGDEAGMTGGRDPDCRRAFDWRPEAQNQALRDYVRDCIALRRDRSVLRHGDFRTITAGDGLYAFRRSSGNESLLIALNADRDPRRLDLTADDSGLSKVALEPVWPSTGNSRDEIPGRSGRVWRVIGASPGASS